MNLLNISGSLYFFSGAFDSAAQTKKYKNYCSVWSLSCFIKLALPERKQYTTFYKKKQFFKT
jgi:hypothetical protein